MRNISTPTVSYTNVPVQSGKIAKSFAGCGYVFRKQRSHLLTWQNYAKKQTLLNDCWEERRDPQFENRAVNEEQAFQGVWEQVAEEYIWT
jgi:hypothetical protein